jgi:hypothetical protein
MADLWIPSDDLLARDPIAQKKVLDPFFPPDLEEEGVVLPDTISEEATEAAAAAALAEAFGTDDERADGSGTSPDDDEVLDSDSDPVSEDI